MIDWAKAGKQNAERRLPARSASAALSAGSESPPPHDLRTPRLTLRRLREDDRDAFVRALRDSRAEVAPRIPLNDIGESDDAFFERLLEQAETGDRNGSAWRRVAVDPAGEIIGCFHLNAITRGLSWEADAAWWVAPGHQRRGYATEAGRAMLAFAFDPMPSGLGLMTVHGGVQPDNQAGIRTVLRCGFERVPGARSHLKIADRWVAHEFYIACAASWNPQDSAGRA